MPTETTLDAASALLLEQRIVYTYDRPIRHLRHRLVTIPRAEHGPEARLRYSLSVSEPNARVRVGTDHFANCVVDVDAHHVSRSIHFEVRALVRRRADRDDAAALVGYGDPRFRRATALTEAAGPLGLVSTELRHAKVQAAERAELACTWASKALRYEYGVTGVRTSAAQAVAIGRGVCQDYAHVMLAVLRGAGVPARYVSGHLIGEGGSHAWVEALVVDESGEAVAMGFDPTHDRRTDERYLTVAVGRDYRDVAPTSGTFSGGGSGRLEVQKRLRRVHADEVDALIES